MTDSTTTELLPVSRLVGMAAPYNPRRIEPDQLAALRSSLRTFGAVEPVVVNRRSGRIVGGHQRVKAAEAEGIAALPVVWVDLDDVGEKQLNLALNRISGEWDEPALAALLEELGSAALNLTGFDGSEIEELIARMRREALGVDPDDVPEPPKVAVTKPGDLYVLGKHRLLCGDATNAGDVTRLLGGVTPGLMVTDPPYGVNYDPSWRNEEARKGNLGYYARRVGKVANDDRADWREAWALFPGDVVYSWHPAGATSLVHAAALQDSGFPIRMQIIWAKSNFQIGRGDYHVRHEPCWYAVRKGKAARRTDDRTQSTLWEINLDKNVEGGHSTQKPCECMERPIRNHEFSDVYDPFCGSGTTLIAAERENRRCYALEIDPIYCDVIVARWESFTGEKATLEQGGDGGIRTHEESS